uniref:Uncharacterized protein n=1 Tax=Peromyscus maniculatus bairdii TaxID=230844 RepID=A0A8C8U7W8_PERMB
MLQKYCFIDQFIPHLGLFRIFLLTNKINFCTFLLFLPTGTCLLHPPSNSHSGLRGALPGRAQPRPAATSLDPAVRAPGSHRGRPQPGQGPSCLPIQLPSLSFGSMPRFGLGSPQPRGGKRPGAGGEQRRGQWPQSAPAPSRG